MPNRTAKFVLAVFASVLAGIPSPQLSHSATPAADDCLSAPKDQTPEGSHWYYRIERGTKRHCWYLREEGEKVSQSAPSSAAPSAKPITPKAEPAIAGFGRGRPRRTACRANARRRRAARPPRRSAPAPMRSAPTASRSRRRMPAHSDRGRLALARAVRSAAPASRPARGRSRCGRRRTCNTRTATPQPLPSCSPPPTTSPEKSVRADSGSIPMLSLVMIGALALAGLIGSAIVRFGGRRRRNRSDIAVRSRRDLGCDQYRSPIAIRLIPAPAARMPRRPGFTCRVNCRWRSYGGPPGRPDYGNAGAARQKRRIAKRLGLFFELPLQLAHECRQTRCGVRASAARPSGSTAPRQRLHRYRD